MSHHIFLSYRRTDQPLARALVAAMESEGLDVWWDQEIEGGEDWREAIVNGLSASNALVILFSEECNASKQLKKELAIADTLDKEVIPVLIEETKPKGHYLYELAARNWLQITPDPESKVGDLAKRLARELGVEPRSERPAPMAAAPAESFQVPPGYEEDADMAGIDPTPAPEPVSPRHAAPAPQAPPHARAVEPPPLPAETVKKVVRAAETEKAIKKDRRDFLPFKWYEVLIAVLLGVFVGYITHETSQDTKLAALDGFLAFGMFLSVIAALVFPFRYFFRRRRVWSALRSYALSNAVLVIILTAVSVVHPQMVDETMDRIGNFLVYLVVWTAFLTVLAIVAFSIYGLLHFQRTMRHFNRNVESI